MCRETYEIKILSPTRRCFNELQIEYSYNRRRERERALDKAGKVYFPFYVLNNEYLSDKSYMIIRILLLSDAWPALVCIVVLVV